MAATAAVGNILLGSRLKMNKYIPHHLCTKFHTCIKKCMIFCLASRLYVATLSTESWPASNIDYVATLWIMNDLCTILAVSLFAKSVQPFSIINRHLLILFLIAQMLSKSSTRDFLFVGKVPFIFYFPIIKLQQTQQIGTLLIMSMFSSCHNVYHSSSVAGAS